MPWKWSRLLLKIILLKNYAQAVYTQIDVMDYNSRIDGKVINCKDFYTNPTEYVAILNVLQRYLKL
jgi:hypothetical protein